MSIRSVQLYRFNTYFSNTDMQSIASNLLSTQRIQTLFSHPLSPISTQIHNIFTVPLPKSMGLSNERTPTPPETPTQPNIPSPPNPIPSPSFPYPEPPPPAPNSQTRSQRFRPVRKNRFPILNTITHNTLLVPEQSAIMILRETPASLNIKPQTSAILLCTILSLNPSPLTLNTDDGTIPPILSRIVIASYMPRLTFILLQHRGTLERRSCIAAEYFRRSWWL